MPVGAVYKHLFSLFSLFFSCYFSCSFPLISCSFPCSLPYSFPVLFPFLFPFLACSEHEVPCSCDRRRGSRIRILLTVGLQKQCVPITVALEQRHPCEPKSGLSLPQSYMFGLLRRFYLNSVPFCACSVYHSLCSKRSGCRIIARESETPQK